MIGAPTSIHGVQDMSPADTGFSRDQRRSRTTAPETSASSSRRAMRNPFTRGCPSPDGPEDRWADTGGDHSSISRLSPP